MSETVKPELSVTKVTDSIKSAADIAAVMDRNDIGFVKIACCNWPDEFPYTPDIRFRIAHTGDTILLNFRCREEYVRAEAPGDNGPVWEDSCVEFFLSPGGQRYYNFECNCGATLLCANGDGRTDRCHCDPELLKSVKRHSSITENRFATRKAPEEWEISLAIPVSVLFNDNITDLSGMDFTANFYKCGDMLPVPHFLSWAPIKVDSPDFHRPEFFGKLHFK